MDPHELWDTTMNPETRSLRRITLNDAIKADQVFTDKTYNTLVSYTVAAGTWCYKLLVEADTDTIYYIRKHKVTDRAPAGFLTEDLRRMSKKR